jgi:chaperone modulatory protein CbpM
MSTFTFQSSDMTVDELCRICAVHRDYVVQLVQEGVIAPSTGNAISTWRFASFHVQHAKIATRLQRDLGVNMEGAALALQLLDELQTLRAQMTVGGVNGVVDTR